MLRVIGKNADYPKMRSKNCPDHKNARLELKCILIFVFSIFVGTTVLFAVVLFFCAFFITNKPHLSAYLIRLREDLASLGFELSVPNNFYFLISFTNCPDHKNEE